ncbi:GntR family transcriptional regulator [Caballeronia pedi]|uniref:GntR family transcriptional regulator n=1 Tax=Caballeronia pedi TaxID=1777141 RepID=A0A158DRT9_9BURK|nr:GNAT family N-acetyltransferase [Caballeronia pedi]SAK97298.1 GntR family transcriptional regulator [Caballeronia pedi]
MNRYLSPVAIDESKPEASKRRPLVDTVTREISQIILEGELKPGDKLNEVEIARRLGVSRGPVREAVRQLQEAGLLDSQPFRGSFVRSLNQKEVSDIYALRSLLESSAVADAIRHATSADLAAIERAMHETETAALANAKSRMIEADVAFHTAICQAGHNDRITDTFIKLASELRLVHLLMNPEQARLRAAAKSHATILDDIRSRGLDRAVSSVRRHINDERDEVLQYLGPHGDSVVVPVAEREAAEEVHISTSLSGRIKVRAHQREDLGLLARMNRELADDEGHRNPMTVAQLEERFRRFVDQEGWNVDLFMLDDEVIGYATHRYEPDPAEPGGRHVYLRQFYIVRHRRRGGAGHVAFDELVRARFQPGERIFLEVIENNPGGKVFWLRTGFTPYGTIMEHLIEPHEKI